MANFPFPKPNIPDPEHRLPFIWKQFIDPCDAPVTVWLEALWPAFLDALIAWYSVDLVQILRSAFKPPLMGWRVRSTRHGGHSSRQRPHGLKRRWKDIITFDPNDWVGHQLNPYFEEEMITLLPGEIEFWMGFELIVMFEFYMQVFDLSTAFLYEWTSGVAKTKYCQARDDAVLVASAPGYPLLGIFGWDAVGTLDVVKMRNIDFFNGFGVSQNVGPGVVSMSFSYENHGGAPGGPWIEARMTCLNGPRAGSYAFRRISSEAGGSGTEGVTYDMSAGEIWIGEIRVNGGYQIINPTLFCHARGSPNP